jgi:hypothetical protein
MRKLASLLTSSALALSFCLSSARPACAQHANKPDANTALHEHEGISHPLSAALTSEAGHSYWTYPVYNAVLVCC